MYFGLDKRRGVSIVRMIFTPLQICTVSLVERNVYYFPSLRTRTQRNKCEWHLNVLRCFGRVFIFFIVDTCYLYRYEYEISRFCMQLRAVYNGAHWWCEKLVNCSCQALRNFQSTTFLLLSRFTCFVLCCRCRFAPVPFVDFYLLSVLCSLFFFFVCWLCVIHVLMIK